MRFTKRVYRKTRDRYILLALEVKHLGEKRGYTEGMRKMFEEHIDFLFRLGNRAKREGIWR